MRNQDRDGAELLMRRIIASAWDNLAERYFELDESARSELASALTDRDGEESLPASAAKP
jgi:hypothetical protein